MRKAYRVLLLSLSLAMVALAVSASTAPASHRLLAAGQPIGEMREASAQEVDEGELDIGTRTLVLQRRLT